MLADDGARGLELAHARAAALDDVERLGQEESPQRRVVPAEGLADSAQLFDRLAGLGRRSGPADARREPGGEDLRRGAVAGGGHGLARSRESPREVTFPRGGVGRLHERVDVRRIYVDRAGPLARPMHARVKRLRGLGLELRAPALDHTDRIVLRGRGPGADVGGALGRELAAGRLLEGGRAAPELDGPSEVGLTIVEVGEVAERTDAVGPLGEEELELVARVADAPEALLEDGRAAEPHGAQELALVGDAAQPVRTEGEVGRELFVVATSRDDRLDRLVGLLVFAVEGEDAAPRPLRRAQIAAPLEDASEALEGRGPPVVADADLDLLEGGDVGSVVPGDLGDALERAPSFEWVGIEPACLELRGDRPDRVASLLPQLREARSSCRRARQPRRATSVAFRCARASISLASPAASRAARSSCSTPARAAPSSHSAARSKRGAALPCSPEATRERAIETRAAARRC